MADEVKLTYFAGRGRAESIRLLMAAAGLKWTEEHLNDPDRVAQIRNEGLVMFGQFPLLQINGLNLVQSQAIIRYLAKKYGFVRDNLEDNTRVDMLAMGATDWYSLGFPGINWYPEEKREDFIKGIMDKSKSRYIPAFEKALKDNGSKGYLVGDTMTVADIILLDVILWVWELDETLVKESTELKAFYDKMTSQPGLKEYLNGPGRFPQPDDKYIQDVKRALSW
ncbi:glutathione S-transferase A4-like isoform X3 [Amphiura filiformis]|uniref:glutathione S-transferase A4-like isoform X3 n=1 Tax=Amphiura filiformis TaxID=82378 RepID=UPI003B221EC4